MLVDPDPGFFTDQFADPGVFSEFISTLRFLALSIIFKATTIGTFISSSRTVRYRFRSKLEASIILTIKSASPERI
jgi:hypothetical protein